MSKDIWHTKDEIPRQESRVLWKSGNAVCGGRFDTYYKCFCGPASQFVDLKSVSRWVYIDDLLALETELERTRKALDKAKWWLKEIVENHRYTPISTAEMALKEITAQNKRMKNE